MSAFLVVCTGNICRSPLGEAFLRRGLAADGAHEVASAGTDARDGDPAMEGSLVAGAERGVDLAAHRARRLTVGQVRDADLVLAMERHHRDAILRAAPDASERTYTLKELVLLLETDGAAAGPLPARLAAAAARRGDVAGADLDVADPYGEALDAYRDTADEIATWTDRLVGALAGLPAGGRA